MSNKVVVCCFVDLCRSPECALLAPLLINFTLCLFFGSPISSTRYRSGLVVVHGRTGRLRNGIENAAPQPQPQIYRGVIDEVVSSLRPDFEEFGVSEDVLAQLQSKWEAKVIASRAADFDSPSNSQFRDDKLSAPVHTPASSKSSYRSTPPVQHRTPQHPLAQIKAEPLEAPRMHTVIPPPRTSSTQPTQFPPGAYGTVHQAFLPPSMASGHPMHAPTAHSYPIPPLGLRADAPHPAPAPGVLMLNRGAPPANGRFMPQMDGASSATSEEDFARMLVGHGAARRRMLERYPWMREAKLEDVALGGDVQMPQLDGPSGGEGSSIPPLSLNLGDIPALSLPAINGAVKKEEEVKTGLGVPALNMTLNLADIPPLQMHLHPSLKSPPPPSSAPLSRASTTTNATTASTKTEGEKTRPAPIANFARNPNLPAQANEDINSDLDDSDEEETEDPNGLPTDPDANVTYCTYDKVTRVKTKWKVVFRDGMVHANGKDYLFGRCTGEFDW